MKQQGLESYASISQNEEVSFVDLTNKLDRILRLYRMVKTNDTSMFGQIQNRVNTILKNMEKINNNKCKEYEQTIKTIIDQSLAQPIKKVQQPIQKAQANLSNSNKQIQSVASPLGSSIQSRTNKQKQLSNVIAKNIQSSSSIFKNNELISEQELQKKKQVLDKKYNMDFGKKEDSSFSGANSQKSIVSLNLRQYCEANSGLIESKIIINEDIFSLFKVQSPEKVAVLGVQKPHDINTDKLYICTYMQFPKSETTSPKQKNYSAEVDEFSNVLRYPLALLVIGQTVSDMKPSYIKFLLQMNSPLPLVIIFNQVAPDKSLVIKMNEKVVFSIQSSSLIEIQKGDFNMKDKAKYKCINLKDIPVTKDKKVSTKVLNKKFSQSVVDNDQAIMVQKGNKNEIKSQIVSSQQKTQQKEQSQQAQQINEFQYILHSKFLSATFQDQFVYLITENNELITKKKVKSLTEAAQFIRNSDRPCVLGITTKASDKKITEQFFMTCFQLLQKCPMMIIRLKTLALHKISFVSFNLGVTQQQVKNANVTFKDIQTNNLIFLNVKILGVNRGDFVNYQGKNALQQI